ncbi:unnamed protein product [Adineta steineri]|uniref:non-specific serine/threonine protein kinase n=1 Tax=Adineta steineri TaxID=433720 RepID=A0A818GJE4_9BILA|nr:unnamed protein product [Adineta steineri]CAF3493148.1 unnamed protein product [Adineta steineri]
MIEINENNDDDDEYDSRQTEIKIIAERFLLKKKIGGGSFGQIYLAHDLEKNISVAVKTERIQAIVPQLPVEKMAFERMKDFIGFPKMIFYGQEKQYYVLVMDLLGPSLEDLFNFCNRSFTLHTTCMIIDQAISRTKQMHNQSLLHRDIKPDNFLMGIGHYSHIVYFVDFGLTKEYRDLVSYVHHNLVKGKNLAGTARYASLHTHTGLTQARRDDLESIVYSLLYFLKGSLPWQGIKAKTKRQKYEKIAELKQTIPLKELCSGMPSQIMTVYIYVKSLTFDEQPDYDYIKRQLRTIIIANNQKYDYQFDWLNKVKRFNLNNDESVIDIKI